MENEYVHRDPLVYMLMPDNIDWYHTINHVINLHTKFKELYKDFVNELGSNIDVNALIDAIDYHDIVYIPGNVCNEQFSAEIYKRTHSDWSQEVVDIILSTSISNIEFDTPEKKIMHDLDCSSFACDTYEKFLNEYIVPVRVEAIVRGGYPTDLVIENQVHFLSHLLEKDKIFLTDTFSGLEKTARKNIKKFLKTHNKIGVVTQDAVVCSSGSV